MDTGTNRIGVRGDSQIIRTHLVPTPLRPNSTKSGQFRLKIKKIVPGQEYRPTESVFIGVHPWSAIRANSCNSCKTVSVLSSFPSCPSVEFSEFMFLRVHPWLKTPESKNYQTNPFIVCPFAHKHRVFKKWPPKNEPIFSRSILAPSRAQRQNYQLNAYFVRYQ